MPPIGFTLGEMESSALNRYYLQVVKDGEKPSWPRPEEELVIGSQPLSGGFIQYWAYHQESGKNPDDLPPAEIVASENPAAKQAILIDQPRPIINEDEDDVLDLILVKDSHAWVLNSSSVSNLEDNLSSVIDMGVDKYDIRVEHFMTTDRVSEDVEKKLDSLEDIEEEGDKPEPVSKGEAEEDTPQQVVEEVTLTHSVETEDVPNSEMGGPMINIHHDQTGSDPDSEKSTPSSLDDMTEGSAIQAEEEDIPAFRHVNTSQHVPSSGIYSASQVRTTSAFNRPSGRGNKIWLLLPIISLIIVAGGAFLYRDRVLSLINGSSSTPTPSPVPAALPTMTPVPTLPPIEREEYKVRVLNGTSTSGLAASLSEKLKGLGWTINRTGNNAEQDIEKGTVKAKPSVDENALKTFMSDLGVKYSSSSSTLKETDTVELEVIIGKDNE